MPSSREARARYRAKLAADPERVARRREYQRAYYADPARVARRQAYQRAYYYRNRETRLTYASAYRADRVEQLQETQREYYRRNRAARLAYARAYSARVKPPREAAAPPPPPPPPPREAAAKVPRRDATLDPIGVLHARLTALAPAYAWRIFDDGIVGRDGKVKLRVLVSGVIYVGTERKNLKKWLQSIGISGEIAL